MATVRWSKMPQAVAPRRSSTPSACTSAMSARPASDSRPSPARGGRAEPRGHLAIVLAAERGIVVDERHADAVARRRARGGEAGRPAADDHAGDGAHGVTRQSPSPRWLSTRMPSRTGVTHARTLGSPSTVTRQSWQTPMPQK